MRLVLPLVVLMLVPTALAETTPGVDVTITLAPDAEPAIDAPPGLVRVNETTPGERYAFDLALVESYTTLELRVRGFDVERPRQMVPSLVVGDDEYPLFYAFPNERVWEADGAARVFHVQGDASDFVLRLGVEGPADHTLVMERDVTPPTFTLGNVTNVTHIGFYQETRTNEMALANLQIRKVGAVEPVENPTPELHVLQRFPIQGLDAETDYEAVVVFEDWAGNVATSETYRVRTAAAPVFPPPTIEVLEPLPNATLSPGTVTVRARIVPAGAPVIQDGIRVFFDVREVTPLIVYNGTVVTYTVLGTLGEGSHRVALEVTDTAGGHAVERWSFHLGDGDRAQTPLPALAGLAALTLAALRRRAA